VVCFKTQSSIPLKRIPLALNGRLPASIRVVSAALVGPKFNPRFAARSKTYEYLVYNGKILNPLCAPFVWHIRQPLNITAMQSAAKYLVGKHDFSSFRAAHSKNSNFVRILHQFVIRYSSLVIWPSCKLEVLSFKVTGNGFLYKMVRNLVGTLVEVGLGRTTPEAIKKILKAKNRKFAGRTAPAHALCLTRIHY
jgi:tRNA pseudouridine38-40 synthase